MNETKVLNLTILKLFKNFHPELIRLFKYGAVSAVALAVDMGLLYALTEWAHFNYLLSATIAFICGLIVNYTLSLRYVFSRSRYNRSREFFLYSLIGVGGLLINDITIYLLVQMSMWYMLAKIIATGIGFIFNFLCRRSLFN